MYFNVNIYNLIQRGSSTADALHQLGAEKPQAGYEAAEGILDEEEYTISQRAYVIETIIAKGPPVDRKIVSQHISNYAEDTTVTEFLKELQLSVLGSAIQSETFGAESPTQFNSPPPQESYDAEPEKIISLFTQGIDEDSDPKEVEQVIKKHKTALSKLSLTAIAIVLEHLATVYDVDPNVSLSENLSNGASINEIGQLLFKASLIEYTKK